ncbi:MAG: cadherin-like beta sandwich domain-containing protein, partial [Gammaproteobacteria bacterium]|nr:cadherin-like beta sandwich domain-containing protein [Gammaproteobacteria bacterium]
VTVTGSFNPGGLIGRAHSQPSEASNNYARTTIFASRFSNRGGLVGQIEGGHSFKDNYATGGDSIRGDTYNVQSLASRNYWRNKENEAQLKAPTAAGENGLYVGWSEEHWDFGTSAQFPILKYVNACEPTTPKAVLGPPICGTLLPNQGTGLRILEVSTSDATTDHVAVLLPAFSSEPDDYVATVPPDADNINLRLKSYDADADIKIKKQGDDTDYFTANRKSIIPLNDDETIVTIHVTEMDTETVISEIIVTEIVEETSGGRVILVPKTFIITNKSSIPTSTTTIYTLQIRDLPITLSAISVAETLATSIEDDNNPDTVNEGSDITLRTTASGGSGDYQYEWTQTPESALDVPDPNNAADLSLKIPENFIGSADTTRSNVTFTVTAMDSSGNFATSKTLTIIKQNNGELSMGLNRNGRTLTAVVTDPDPDGNPDPIPYRWQRCLAADCSAETDWQPIPEANDQETYVIPQTTVDVSYRASITYTDNQGYDATIMTRSHQYAALKSVISVTEIPANNITDDNNTDNTVNEGSDITLRATGSGGSGGGNYGYRWTQTPANAFTLTTTDSDILSFNIADNFIQSATSDTISVIFKVTTIDNDSEDYLPATESTTLTIVKRNNGDLLMGLVNTDSATLTAEIAEDKDDPDGGHDADTINYLWQDCLADCSMETADWQNIGTATKTKTYTVPQTAVDIDYRVRVTYKDNQGYSTTITTVSYQYEAPDWEIRVTEDPAANIDDNDNTDDTLNEGSDVTLRITADGVIGDYQYQWDETLVTASTTTATLNFGIPDTFIDKTLAESAVTFTATVTDSEDNTALIRKILTIKKQNNGEPSVELDVNGTTLTAVVGTDDPDGGPDTNTLVYQWQRQVEGSTSWADIDGADAKTYTVPRTAVDIDYRVRITYTDNQNYTTTTVIPGTHKYQAPDWEIQVTEVPAANIMDDDNTDDTVNEGSDVTLLITADGVIGDYEYEWTGTPDTLDITNLGTTGLRFDIPDDFVETLAEDDVTFKATVTDSEGLSAPVSKTLTIKKRDNGTLGMKFGEDLNADGTATLTVSVGMDDRDRDPDGGYDPDTLTYQWQSQIGDLGWKDIDEAEANTYTVMPTVNDTNYQVVVRYTDNQGHDTRLEVGVFSYKAPIPEPGTFVCDYATDIDRDDDGLIEICDLEGLNAIRHQLDGSGYRATSTATLITAGCPTVDSMEKCNGYELTKHLDFNKDASYRNVANKATWTRGSDMDPGEGWQPIGSITGGICQNDGSRCFAAIFEGNGYTLSNLYINRRQNYEALFGALGNSEIRNIGLLKVRVSGNNQIGGLGGHNRRGLIQNSYVIGDIRGVGQIGGLVGINNARNTSNSSNPKIKNSYARAKV